MMKIGAQFYTLRDMCKTPEGLAESLKRVADMGYRYVQISGTCAYAPEWMKTELEKNGLKCVLTHVPGTRILGDTRQLIADHDVFGCDRIGLGWFGFNDDQSEQSWDYFMAHYVPAAKKLKEGGKLFMYHNHDQEFRHRDGKTILRRLSEEVPADIMGFTFDTFWAQAGGADPAQCLEMLSGRIPCIHLKDYAYGRKMAVVGEGNINFERVLAAAEKGGTEYLLVEQDDCNGEDPFDCLRRSLSNLRAMGLE